MNTKRQDKILPLLTRPHGASVAEMAEVADMEERHVHAVLSTLRRAGAFTITSTKEARERIYKAMPIAKDGQP